MVAGVGEVETPPTMAHLDLCPKKNRDRCQQRTGLGALNREERRRKRRGSSPVTCCRFVFSLLCMCVLYFFLNNHLLIPLGCQLVNGFLEKASEKVLDASSSDFTR